MCAYILLAENNQAINVNASTNIDLTKERFNTQVLHCVGLSLNNTNINDFGSAYEKYQLVCHTNENIVLDLYQDILESMVSGTGKMVRTDNNMIFRRKYIREKN